jgi:hypothetical protein
MPEKTAFPRGSNAPAVFHSPRPHLSADLHAVFTDGRPITAATKQGYLLANRPTNRDEIGYVQSTMWVRSLDFAIFIPQCELADSNVDRFGGLV